MARKQKFDYFKAFVKISDYAVQYADELVRFLESQYDEEKQIGMLDQGAVLEHLLSMHKIEEDSDQITHDITDHLSTEFIAPIEREDILALCDELDTVVDELDDVLQRIYMYNLPFITSEVMEMAHIVHKSTLALHSACEKFTHFKKSKSIKSYIVELNSCEDEGDKVYIKSVHNIYKRAQEGEFEQAFIPIGLHGALSALKECCDACEAAGDIMVTVRLKNS